MPDVLCTLSLLFPIITLQMKCFYLHFPFGGVRPSNSPKVIYQIKRQGLGLDIGLAEAESVFLLLWHTGLIWDRLKPLERRNNMFLKKAD